MTNFVPPPGFNVEAHKAYIESGGCPYVLDKIWCNGRKGDLHQDHWALHWHPGTKVTKVKLFRAKRAVYDD